MLVMDHYPAFDFSPTRLNPSDNPSRGRPVSAPSAEPPSWLVAAGGESPQLEGLLAWSALPRQKRATSEWARLVTKLVLLYHGRRFDSTLGYPGEGPSAAAAAVVALVVAACSSTTTAAPAQLFRPPVDLQGRPTLTPATQALRQQLCRDLESWLSSLAGRDLPLSEFVTWSLVR